MERGTDPELGEGVWGGLCSGALAAKKVFGREETLCSACVNTSEKAQGSVGGSLPLDLGKEMELGVLGWKKILCSVWWVVLARGFSVWPSLPSADSGAGAGRGAEPATDAGGGAGARMQSSSWGVEKLESIPASASKFCKWQQFLQRSKLLQPDGLVHLKSWLRLKMFIF